ncbi:MAG: hypothetical protein GX357_09995 [Firmicutes bacterium]|nr:hypothetical protein [Bacillota bacterium]
MHQINLLPAEILIARRQKALRSRMITLGIIAAIVFIFGIGTFWFLTEYTFKQIDTVRQVRQVVAQEAELYKPVQQLNHEVKKRTEILQTALGTELNWRRLLLLLSDRIPDNVWLTGAQIRFDGKTAAMTLQGMAANHPATAAWAAALQAAAEIDEVQINYSVEEMMSTGENEVRKMVRFEISALMAVETAEELQ